MVIENFRVVNIHVEKETKECGLTSAENLLNNLLKKKTETEKKFHDALKGLEKMKLPFQED